MMMVLVSLRFLTQFKDSQASVQAQVKWAATNALTFVWKHKVTVSQLGQKKSFTHKQGVSFDFKAADAFVDESGSERRKRFRGALDAVFAAAAKSEASPSSQA